jgi:CheY-like chemotaxis protein
VSIEPGKDFGDTAFGQRDALTADGHTVAQAPDGRTAIETATAFRPDVVILDIGMPGMNGYTVAQTLRKECRHVLGRYSRVVGTGPARGQSSRG